MHTLHKMMSWLASIQHVLIWIPCSARPELSFMIWVSVDFTSPLSPVNFNNFLRLPLDVSSPIPYCSLDRMRSEMRISICSSTEMEEGSFSLGNSSNSLAQNFYNKMEFPSNKHDNWIIVTTYTLPTKVPNVKVFLTKNLYYNFTHLQCF